MSKNSAANQKRNGRRTDPVSETPRLSVVAPCFNEAPVIDKLYQRLTQVCGREVGDKGYEIILVDDGSTDATWRKIESLADHDSHVVAVCLSRNHGHQLALSAGLTVCRGERVLIIDADLQDPPELLPDMMRLMGEGADVVYGQRTRRAGETLFKRATAALFYRLLDRMVEVRIPVDTGDFRLISRRALDVLISMPEQHRFIRGMVSWIGLNQVPLKYERQARGAGETHYPLGRMLRFAADAITSFSVRPLRLASYLGLAFGFLAIIALGYTFIGWITGNAVEGWTSIMSVVLTLGSAQLLVIGVMGEYLGRLYMEAKRRPMFVVDKIVRQADKPKDTSAEGEVSDAAVIRLSRASGTRSAR